MPTWTLFSHKKPQCTLSSQSLPLLSETSRLNPEFSDSPTQQELADSLILNVSTHSSDNDIINTVSAIANSSSSSHASPSSSSNSSSKPAKPKSTIHECICCDTQLRFPKGLSYFKCAVCGTFYDAPPNSNNSKTPATFLTLQAIEEAVEKDTQNITQTVNDNNDGNNNTNPHTYLHLQNLITSTFSSVDALNNSFQIGLTKLSFSRPNIDFEDVDTFYTILTSIPISSSSSSSSPFITLLTTTLALLKRPRKEVITPQDAAFLLIILENPIFRSHSLFSTLGLKPNKEKTQGKGKKSDTKSKTFDKKWSSKALKSIVNMYSSSKNKEPEIEIEIETQQNDETPKLDQTFQLTPEIAQLAIEILERCISILAHTPKLTCHYLLNWFTRYDVEQFSSKVQVYNAYISYRLGVLSTLSGFNKPSTSLPLLDTFSRSSQLRKLDVVPGDPMSSEETLIDAEIPLDPEMVPIDMAGTEFGTAPTLLVEGRRNLTSDSKIKRKRDSFSKVKVNQYGNDWRIIGFSRILGILFSANLITNKISTDLFYNTMIDYIDIKSDFDAWEKLALTIRALKPSSSGSSTSLDNFKVPIFAFCEYPFFLSMGVKKHILEYDAKRQMAAKAHEAFFTSLGANTPPQQMYLIVKVRRNHILQDSFQVFETQEEDLKKSIRVQFVGEPGIDVGGLRKEWFLLLTRELVSCSQELFSINEESGYTWFNTVSNKPLKYYKLTGVALGLALYNSTILDANFPPVLFKKLQGVPYNLDDFKELNPRYGKSLQQLLDYKCDDVEEVFCLTFSVTKQVKGGNGQVFEEEEDLIPNGRNISVTRSNRHEYVKQVVKYHLGSSVRRMFEPLKQGFFKVVGSNALTLFQPEEVELLIRGSDEPINVDALRAVTRYKHWPVAKYKNPDTDAQVVDWFWRYFKALDGPMQRKLLMFVTGSDRIPATGISTMAFTITRAGGDCERYPESHTCFNELCLYEYGSKQKLVNMLTRAISDSEGFGLK